MNVDDIVRDALREQAAEQPPVAAGFADRVLAVRRRRRSRRIALAAAAAVAVVAVGVAVPLLDSGKDDVRPSGGGGVVVEKKTKAHPDQSPPREEISVGGTTLVGYFIPETVKKSADTAVSQRTYHLLNPRTGTYEKAPDWSWVAVAPGGKTAAVLERDLPASRIGLLDLTSGKVERWIKVDHGVGGLSFSRDGRKLVATTYSQNPDGLVKAEGDVEWGQPMTSSRTGFYVLDVASGDGAWTEIKTGGLPGGPTGSTFMNSRQDFALTDDGRHVWEGSPMEPGYVFYDLTGKKVSVAGGLQVPVVVRGRGPVARRQARRRGLRGQEVEDVVVRRRREDRSPDRGTRPAAARLGGQQAAHRLGHRQERQERVPPAAGAGHHRQRQGGPAQRLP